MLKIFLFCFITISISFSNTSIKSLYQTKEVELKRINLYLEKMNNIIKLENDIKNIILNKIKTNPLIISNLLLRNLNNKFISNLDISSSSTTTSNDYKKFVSDSGYSFFLNDTILNRAKNKRYFLNNSSIFIDFNNKGFEICNLLGEDKENIAPKFVKDFYKNNTSKRTGIYFFNEYTEATSGPNLEKNTCIFYLFPKSLKEESKSNSKLQELGIKTYFADECLKPSQQNNTIIIKDGPTLNVGLCENNQFNFIRTLGPIPNYFKPNTNTDGNNLNSYKYPSEFVSTQGLDLEEYFKQFNYSTDEYKDTYNIYHFVNRNTDINKPNFLGGNYSFNKLDFANTDYLLNIPLASQKVSYPYIMYFDDPNEALYLKRPCSNNLLNQNCTIFLNYLTELTNDDQGILTNSNLSTASNGYFFNNVSILNSDTLPISENNTIKNYNLYFGKRNMIDNIYLNSTFSLSNKNSTTSWDNRKEINGFGTFSQDYLINFYQ